MHTVEIKPYANITERVNQRIDEYDDIILLLTDHRRDDSQVTRNVVLSIAEACMGEQHLWQDLRLPDREALSMLMQTYFPKLFAKNTANMKWKKFFYKQLCERAEIFICKSPSCGICEDYGDCFEGAQPNILEA